MKKLLLLLPFLAPPLALAQSTIESQVLFTIQLTSMVPVTAGSNNPLGIAHVGLAAYWHPPDTNYWQPEFNFPAYNGTNWSFCGNHWIGPGGWHSTETGTNWMINGLPVTISNQWTVRIRQLTPPAPAPPFFAPEAPESVSGRLLPPF
jgi:hypothetical protein